MKFHVELIARDNFDPMGAVLVQKMVLAQLNKLLESGKVKDYGSYSDERGAFLILEAGTPEELFEMFGPLLDAMSIRTHPYVSIDSMKAFFEAYEKMMKAQKPGNKLIEDLHALA